MASTILDRVLPNWVSLRCQGRLLLLRLGQHTAILPISVSMPVAVTTMRPRPYTTAEPM